jgi:hypothetical protein
MSLSSVFKNADLITSLPMDDSDPSLKEKSILDMLYPYKENYSNTNNTNTNNTNTNNNTNNDNTNTNTNNDTKDKSVFRYKDIIVASFVFVLLNLPLTDRILERYIKTTNDYYRLSVKSLLFFILLFVINNFLLKKY